MKANSLEKKGAIQHLDRKNCTSQSWQAEMDMSADAVTKATMFPASTSSCMTILPLDYSTQIDEDE